MLILPLRHWLVNVVAATEVDDYRKAISQLCTVSFAQAKALLGQLEDANPILFRDRLLEAFPAVVAPYMTAAGDLSAAWYEEMRAESVGGSFAAASSVDASPDAMESLVRHSMTPVFQGSTSTVLGLLAGGMQRLISNGARDTIYDNVMVDRVRVGYARIPRPGCCSFCGMLASRGAAYNSATSAGSVVGGGVDASVTRGKVGGQGKGVKARGSQALGKQFHDFCQCIAMPVFQGDTFHKDVEAKYQKMYDDSFELKENGSIGAKNTLANWRQVHGTK